MLSVRVALLDDVEYSLPITPNTTAKDLKTMLSEELMLLPESFCLTYEGSHLSDKVQITDYGVEPGDELRMEVSALTMALRELGELTPTTENLVSDITNNNGKMVDTFIRAGTPIDSRCPTTGATPLTAACRLLDINAASLLLEAGADTEATSCDPFETPLFISSAMNSLDLVELLISSGAQPDSLSGPYRQTALFEAAKNNNISILTTLIAAHTTLSIQNVVGETALYVACASGSERSVEILIQNGADVNLRGGYGFSPLFVASQRGYEPIARHLLKAGADCNAAAGCGQTPLHSAARHGAYSIVELLIGYGAEHQTDNFGNTPTTEALKTNLTDIVTLLQTAITPATKAPNPYIITNVFQQSTHAERLCSLSDDEFRSVIPPTE